MKASQLKDLLVFAIKNKISILIKGIPGIGKTDIVHAATTEVDADMIVTHPVVSDPTDYKGLPFAGKDNTAHFLPFGDLQRLIDAKKPTVFFMDDIGQAPASVQAALMQLILARQINGHKISENVTFIGATNRREDKAGVSGLLEPVKSRFRTIVELDVDTDDWCEWAIDNDLPTELVAFIRWRPELLTKFVASKDIVNTSSPRTVTAVGNWQKNGLPKAMEFEVFKGAAGEGFATEYMGFLKVFRELPSFEEIVMNPKSVPLPKEPSQQYAVSGLLSGRMSEQNIESCLTYLNRMESKEIEVCTIKYAVKRDISIAKTKSYIGWSTKNAKFFL